MRNIGTEKLSEEWKKYLNRLSNIPGSAFPGSEDWNHREIKIAVLGIRDKFLQISRRNPDVTVIVDGVRLYTDLPRFEKDRLCIQNAALTPYDEEEMEGVTLSRSFWYWRKKRPAAALQTFCCIQYDETGKLKNIATELKQFVGLRMARKTLPLSALRSNSPLILQAERTVESPPVHIQHAISRNETYMKLFLLYGDPKKKQEKTLLVDRVPLVATPEKLFDCFRRQIERACGEKLPILTPKAI